MKPFPFILALALMPALAGPLAAKDAGGFVVRLGDDTTAVVRYVDHGDRLEFDEVARSPRVVLRHGVYQFGRDGATKRFTIAMRSPGAAANAPPLQTLTGTVTPDSVFTLSKRGDNTRSYRAAVPENSVVVLFQSPWCLYQRALERFVKSRADTMRVGLYYMGASGADWIRMQRDGRDSVLFVDSHEDVFRLGVDRNGRMLAALPISGTGKFTVTRDDRANLAAIAASWSAVEKSSGAMGQLSTRDTVTAVAGGASIWVDYGRPAKRGRVVFGGVVPLGALWRTGANAATQFRTDRALEFDGHTLAPGTYTLWTVPNDGEWTLVFNSQTGQWGTDHDPGKDLFRVPMAVSALDEPVERFTIGVEPKSDGGTLFMEWDRTRAEIDFRVTSSSN